MEKIIEFKNVTRYYKTMSVITKALDDVSFTINEGEFVIILGDSGSGKSTALNLIGGIDRLTGGEIYFKDKNISTLKRQELNEYRALNVGIVFQNYNLINNLSVLENVKIVNDIKDNNLDAKEMLTRVGLANKLDRFPIELSGGEQQRVAIARALVKKPDILLCDEPTGALDYENSKNILKLLKDLNINYNITTIIVTHNQAFKKVADKIITLKSGKVINIINNDNPLPVEKLEW
ncbi:MAG: ABC transporter ATP-binding protein [Bacilli bacterium]|nr:ABC transporter ATP-binding protein [Bacilli bacterium]